MRICEAKQKIIFLVTAALLLGMVFVVLTPSSVHSLVGSQFQAGRIIDDPVFYDSSTMDTSQIQAFLDAKVPVCDTYGVQPTRGTTRAAYGASVGHPAPYTCLKDYVEDVPAIVNSPADYCTGSISAGNKSSAQIISEVSSACGINPQVLIVLLQKEQALITDDWPWSTQYRSATGYGCPDTAPCNSEYYGFFNQVYQAAKAFKRYAANPNLYGYRSGAVNFIHYNPNLSGCGGSNVFLENQATASLYIYTPYQPNQAALDNLYGSGDGCSAYGNRNFWRMFNDWFGTTLGSYFLRSPENATVYLVTETHKFPVSNGYLIGALYPLGGVSFVGQQYLDTKTTGSFLDRLILDPGGTVYFYDAGIKLPFSSCALVAHYGLSCGDAIPLTQIQIDSLTTGPAMTRYFGTQNGKSFYIDSGQKREIFDSQSLVDTGIGMGSFNVLNESALAGLSYGSPIIRDGVLVYDRSRPDVFVHQLGVLNPVTGSVYGQTALADHVDGSYLDRESVAMLTESDIFNGFIRNAAATEHYVLDSQGKAIIANPSNWTSNFVVSSAELINSLPVSTQQMSSNIVKSPSNGTVYYVDSAHKRPIHEWEDLMRLAIVPFSISTISDTSISTLNTGNRLLGVGRLVKSPSSATVYIVIDTNKLAPLSTFAVPLNLGTGLSIKVIDQAFIDQYMINPSPLGLAITCNGKNYIASNGKLHHVPAVHQSNYGLVYTPVESVLCANTGGEGKSLDRFIHTPSGTIYYIDSGQRRPIGSFSTYLSLGGSAANTTTLSDISALVLPTGTVIY